MLRSFEGPPEEHVRRTLQIVSFATVGAFQVEGEAYSPRTGHAVVVWGNYFFVFGGTDETARHNDIYMYETNSARSAGQHENAPFLALEEDASAFGSRYFWTLWEMYWTHCRRF